jgi:DNA polymerase I-like protein with 3'-5' exonuclease and polymerase domains
MGDAFGVAHSNVDVLSLASALLQRIANAKAKGIQLILVGHHIKFDLIYIKRLDPDAYGLLITLPIWDTSIAEYLISGQRHTFPSLKDVAKRRCPDSEGKADTLANLIAAGKTTEDIDIDDLIKYCAQDVNVTLEVALDQIREVKDNPAMMSLIMMHSNVSKVLAEMEDSGVHFDMDRALKAANNTDLERILTRASIGEAVRARVEGQCGVDVSEQVAACSDQWMGSTAFWSSYLFGGMYKFKFKKPNGEWKSGPNKGKTRFSTEERTIEFNSLITPSTVGAKRGANGHWSVDEATLSKAHALTMFTIVRDLLELRRLDKILNTYLTSLPKKATNGFLHPNINQTATHTGRFSQNNPNLQNVSGEDTVKECFIPRYVDHGFIEADYKQLELCIFAHVYKDPQLLADLRVGTDVHTTIGRTLYGARFNDTLRRKVKGVVFGMIYGGGADTLSDQVGLPVDDVRKVINKFHTRYPTIRPVRIAMMAKASEAAKKGLCLKDDAALYYLMPSPTGRIYSIPMSKHSISSGMEYEPHYTTICNYPIQGLATGDIVPMMLLHLWQEIRRRMVETFMVNTVHDSILFEAPKFDLPAIAKWIKQELERAPEIFESLFGESLDVALPVSVKYTEGTWAGPWVKVDDDSF